MNNNKRFSIKVNFHAGYVAKDIRHTSALNISALKSTLQEWKSVEGAYSIEVLDRTTGQETVYEKHENGATWSKTSLEIAGVA